MVNNNNIIIHKHLETSILSFKNYLLKIEQLKIWKIKLMNVDILYSSSKKLKITKIYNNDSSVLLEIMRDFEFIYSNLIEDGITS